MNFIHKIQYAVLAVLMLALSASCQTEDFLTYETRESGFYVSFEEGNVSDVTKGSVKFTDINAGNVVLNATISVEPTSSVLTKGTPVDDMEDFLAGVNDFMVWGFKNNTTKLDYCPFTLPSDKTKPAKVKYLGGYYYRPVDATSGEYVNWNDGTKNIGSLVNPHFYALAPYTYKGTVGTPSHSVSSNKGTVTFQYTMPAPDTKVNCDAQAQEEIFGAFMSEAPENDRIPLQFKPLLAALRFRVGEVGRAFTVNSITIQNIYQIGTAKISENEPHFTWSSQKTLKAFKQIFDFEVTTETPEGTDINDEDLSKTFLVVPQTCVDGADVVIDYTDIYGTHELHAPITGLVLEAGNTYTFNLYSSEPGEITVNFSEVYKNNSNPTTNLHVENNNYFQMFYRQTEGTYEKAEFPIINLVPGTLYKITFSEDITGADPLFNGKDGRGGYGCTVRENIITGAGNSSQITFYPNDSDSWNMYDWIPTEGTLDYTPTHSDPLPEKLPSIVFRATKSTMYWIWEYSKCKDNSDAKIKVYFHGIEVIEPPVVPAVDFPNSIHYNFYHVALEDEFGGYSSYKTVASYDSMEFHARGRNRNGRINIPLINLEEGHKYKIQYILRRTEGTSYTTTGSKRRFGYSVLDAPRTDNNDYVPDKDFLTDYTSPTFEINDSFEFEATAETMYWVWEMSQLKEYARNTFFFEDVTITDVTSL